jgi:hypothetical protein
MSGQLDEGTVLLLLGKLVTSSSWAMLHAQAIQSQMRLSSEPALHIPHCTFLAGIAYYSSICFRRPAVAAQYANLEPHRNFQSST